MKPPIPTYIGENMFSTNFKPLIIILVIAAILFSLYYYSTKSNGENTI